MAQNFSLDEIKARIIARGSKASKIDWLVKEAGYKKEDAESTYRLVMSFQERPEHVALRRAAIHFTMGIELECTNVNRFAIVRECTNRGISIEDEGGSYFHSNDNRAYQMKADGSLCSDAGDAYGTCEIVTPVLRSLDSLKVVCEVINAAGAKANRSCGFHVHFGAQDFTDAIWRRVVINYARLERLIDSFMPMSRRGDNNTYCGTMLGGLTWLEEHPNATREEMRRLYRCDRYHKVNLEAYGSHKTIEFRQHSGTTSYTKIENWVKFLAALLTYSIQNETLVEARTIDEIPFLNNAQKAYFKGRAEELAR